MYNRLQLFKRFIKFFKQALRFWLIFFILWIIFNMRFYFELSAGLLIILILILTFYSSYGYMLYYVMHDIIYMNIEEFKGEIGKKQYLKCRDFLPCGITVGKIKNDGKRYQGKRYLRFHCTENIDADLGDIVKLTYLKKSKFVIEIDIVRKSRKKNKVQEKMIHC